MKGIYIHLFFHFTDSKIQVVNVVKNNGKERNISLIEAGQHTKCEIR